MWWSSSLLSYYSICSLTVSWCSNTAIKKVLHTANTSTWIKTPNDVNEGGSVIPTEDITQETIQFWGTCTRQYKIVYHYTVNLKPTEDIWLNICTFTCYWWYCSFKCKTFTCCGVLLLSGIAVFTAVKDLNTKYLHFINTENKVRNLSHWNSSETHIKDTTICHNHSNVQF